MDDIVVESFPIFFHKLSVVNFLEKDESDNDKPHLKLKIFNNENPLINAQLNVDFMGKTKNRSIIQLGEINLPEPGKVHFVITDETDNELDRYSINLQARYS